MKSCQLMNLVSVMSDSLIPHGLQPPGSSVHGISQVRVLEWVAISSFPTQGSNLGLLHCRQMLYHLSHQGSPVRMAIIKKSTKNKCWRRCEEKGTLLHRWWECKLIQPLWKTVWRFLKKLGIKPPYDPGIPLLGIYPEETRTGKSTCT